MAVVVDRFSFLAKEIVSVATSVRDALALIGALYAARKTLQLTWQVYKAVKAHGLSKLSRPDLAYRYGPWAVVTGSTSGIGKAFAQELASCGLNIIIVSLGQADCDTVARMLEETFKVKTHIIPVDFNEGRSVYDGIKEGLKDKEIGILVNNVGVFYDYPKYFLDVPEERLWQLVHVNVAAATMMTHIVLPQMVKRGRGAIVTVSSGASNLPSPQMTVYSATKAYLDYFTRALNYEYKDSGVTIQCLMPFYVATRMTQYSSTLSNTGFFIPSATAYVRQALWTLGWSDRTTGYWPHTIQLWLSSYVPEWLWMWGSSRLNSAFRRQAQQRIRHKSGSKTPQHSLLT